jgi:CrcB protein
MASPPSLALLAAAVAAGSAVGGVARFAVAELLARQQAGAFPWATLLVNVTGSLAIGLLAATLGAGGRWSVPPVWQNLLLVGVLGGFTTFSTFSLQTILLMRSGHEGLAALNVLGSVALCLLGAWAGLRLGAWIGR